MPDCDPCKCPRCSGTSFERYGDREDGQPARGWRCSSCKMPKSPDTQTYCRWAVRRKGSTELGVELNPFKTREGAEACRALFPSPGLFELVRLTITESE